MQKEKSYFIHFGKKDKNFKQILDDKYEKFGIETKTDEGFQPDELVVFVFDHPAEEMLLKDVYRIISVERKLEKENCVLHLVKTNLTIADIY